MVCEVRVLGVLPSLALPNVPARASEGLVRGLLAFTSPTKLPASPSPSPFHMPGVRLADLVLVICALRLDGVDALQQDIASLSSGSVGTRAQLY